MTQEAQNRDMHMGDAPHIAAANIYELEAYQAFTRFERFIEGSPNDIILAVSSSVLDARSRDALISSAERLGLGGARISWATILGRENGSEPVPISPQNLQLLIESIDPIAIVATDIGAMSVISEAYSISLEADSANRVACRTCVAFTDLNSMLDDDDQKQRAWHVLKSLAQI